MPLPPKMNKVIDSAGGNVVTYSYYDIAEGRGIQIFYPAISDEGGFYGPSITEWTSGTYVLTTNALYSDQIVPSASANDLNGVRTLIQDINFDALFRLPKIIEGNAYVSIPHGTASTTAGKQETVQTEVKVYHVTSGGTATLLGSTSSAYLTSPVGGQDAETKLMKVVLPNQHFRAGESLRLKIANWGINGDAATGGKIGFGCDPQARADDNTVEIIDSSVTTKTEFHVPFVLDI